MQSTERLLSAEGIKDDFVENLLLSSKRLMVWVRGIWVDSGSKEGLSCTESSSGGCARNECKQSEGIREGGCCSVLCITLNLNRQIYCYCPYLPISLSLRFIHFGKAELQREWETETKIFCGWSWTDQKPRSRSFFLWVSQVSVGTQGFGPFAAAFPGHK